jgi:hypothetical protein
MKPDWKDAPYWAKFLAQNTDGRWFWHECAPFWLEGDWHSYGHSCMAGKGEPQIGLCEPSPQAAIASKPNWKDAPEWAQWLAQDASHSWYWHELEPEPEDGVWESDGLCRAASEDITVRCGLMGEVGPCEPRPEPQS